MLRDPTGAAQHRATESLQLEQDFAILLQLLRRDGGEDLQPGSEEWSLKMMAGAARLSSPHISGNRAEVWFQLLCV